MFVDIIRKNLKSQNIDEAVENAVNYCIEHNILAEFLRKNKAEVMEVAIFECDIEEEIKKIGNDKYDDGFDAGFKDGFNNGFNDGFNDGELKAMKLIQLLLQDNRTDDISRIISDEEYKQQLYNIWR